MFKALAIGLAAAVVAGGCSKPAALRPGDVVRPQLAVAPDPPWRAGAAATIGMLIEVHRPGRPDVAFLREDDVPADGLDMRGTLTFTSGDRSLGEPLKIAFVRDC